MIDSRETPTFKRTGKKPTNCNRDQKGEGPGRGEREANGAPFTEAKGRECRK